MRGAERVCGEAVMKRSFIDMLNSSGLIGMVLVLGDGRWAGIWLPERGRRKAAEARRTSNGADALAQARVANR